MNDWQEPRFRNAAMALIPEDVAAYPFFWTGLPTGASRRNQLATPNQTGSTSTIRGSYVSTASATQAPPFLDWLHQLRSVSASFQPLYERLDQIKLETECWSRSEIDPPDDRALEEAQALLVRLEANALLPAGVIASADGGIGVHFKQGRRYADFECLNNGEITGLTSDGEGHVKTFRIDSSFEGLNRVITRIREFLKG